MSIHKASRSVYQDSKNLTETRTTELETTSRFVRRAQPGEAQKLTALLHRSKAHWGYDEAFMFQARQVMFVTEQDIRENWVYVCENELGMALGFYQLRSTQSRSSLYLEDLFIEPAAIGHGIGRRLFDHAAQMARSLGYCELSFEADPNAEGFYLKLDALRVGQTESRIVQGLFIPQMIFRIPNCL
jgi:GNAT superfamily N-acetyltransferase